MLVVGDVSKRNWIVSERFHIMMGEFWGNLSGYALLKCAIHAAAILDILTLERINAIMHTAEDVGWDKNNPTNRLAPLRAGQNEA